MGARETNWQLRADAWSATVNKRCGLVVGVFVQLFMSAFGRRAGHVCSGAPI